MTKAFEEIMRGMEEAIAFARGESTGCVVHYGKDTAASLARGAKGAGRVSGSATRPTSNGGKPAHGHTEK